MTISQGVVGNLGVEVDHLPQDVCRPSPRGDLVLTADGAHRRQHGRAVALGHKHEARLREPRREAESSGVPPRPHSAEGACFLYLHIT